MLAGAATVVQGGLNRRIADLWGHAPTILINGLVVTIAAAFTIWLASRIDSPLTNLLGAKPEAFSRTLWWYVVPGLLGYVFLTTLPPSIASIGASNVFVLVVAGQLLMGLFWDRAVEDITLSLPRVGGVALVCVGAWLSTLR